MLSNISQLWQRKQPYTSLFLFLSFNAVLVAIRVLYTDSWLFVFLLWNLFLAAIPLGLILVAEKAIRQKWNYLFWIPCLAAAILFLPNAPYIVTDLFHLRYSTAAPLWYDTLLVFSCAISGLFFFYISLVKMEKIAHQKLPKRLSLILVPMIIFLCSFGIYLGRFVRFNSWDILTNPSSLLYEMADRVLNPFAHQMTWQVTLAYGFFFWIGYQFVKRLRFA